MDFDDLEPPNQTAVSRVSKFAPKSSKHKPKKEPHLVPKQEPSSLPSTKTEPQEPGLTAKQDENCFETMAPTQTKPEPNDAVKTDVVLKPESKEDSTKVDSMDEEMAEAEEDSRQVDDPMDEEDTVVREIDVYFSPSIDADTQLYILQYPLRPNWRPYDFDEECEEVRLNPKSSEVQIDLSVDLRSSNVDEDQANKLNYKKQTLSTKWKPPPADGCAVGLLMGDKLHLHPVNAVVQLRPSRDHLNSGGSVKKNVGAKSEGSIEDKSVATSKMQCWVPLKYHGCKSDISSRYFQQMVAQESSPINFEMSSYDYIAALCPGISSNTLAKGPSKRRLLSLPVEERLQKMLIEGPPLHRFSAIKHFAPEYSDDELLDFLQQHALLLRGFWVPKSRLLYPKGGAEMMTRNYALVMLSKSSKVLSSDVKLKNALGDHVKNFLNQFALEKIDLKDKVSYWKFTAPPDESFIKKFPNVVKQQEEIFKILDQELSSVLSNVGKNRESKSAVTNSGVNSDLVRSANSNPQVTSLGEVPPTSLGEVPPRKMTMSSETHHALPIALKKLFQTHKVCSFQLICQELRGLALAKTMLPKGGSKIAVDAAQSLDVPQDELKAVLSEVACDIHGCYVLQSSPDDPFRDVVIDMLRGSGPNGKLKKAEILEAARRKLSRDVPNNEYIKAMTELCVSRGSVWVLKSGDGSKQ